MISLRTEKNEPSSRNEYFRVVFKIDTAIEAGTNLKLTIYKVPTLKDQINLRSMKLKIMTLQNFDHYPRGEIEYSLNKVSDSLSERHEPGSAFLSVNSALPKI